MDRFVGAIDSLRLPSAVGVQKTTSPAAGVNSVSLCRSIANPSDPDPMSGSLGWNRAAADGGGEDVGEEDAENDERFYDTIEDLPKNAEQGEFTKLQIKTALKFSVSDPHFLRGSEPGRKSSCGSGSWGFFHVSDDFEQQKSKKGFFFQFPRLF